MPYERVTVVDHPMVQHKLSKLRNKDTSSKDFRALVRELAMFEGYEATRDLELEDVEVETPICKTTCKQVAGKKMVDRAHPARGAGAWWKGCRSSCRPRSWGIWACTATP